jgi:putative NADH-flavin reductase
MILTIFGATGKVGKRIVRYALAKGHIVRAFGRNITKLIDEDLRNDHLKAIKGAVFDTGEVLNAISGADAVLSVLGGSFDGTDKARSLGMKNIVAQMEKARVEKIVALGGFGILSTPDGGFLMDEPDYPKEYLPVGNEHKQAYLYLKDSNLDYTFVCSPDIKDKDATEEYVTSETYPPASDKFYIAAGDLAHFMVNEAEQQKYERERVGICAV